MGTGLVRGALESMVAAILAVIAMVLAQAGEVPAAGWVTGAAGVIGVVAIGQMVRAISRTEAQKTELVEALQQQLNEAREEIRALYEQRRGDQ